MKIRVYKILKHTKVEGPGMRYCIWFQGCSRHCKGCWAKATWAHNGGLEYDADKIIDDIISTKNIEGVTFLGGEPFEQADALLYISHKLKELTNLSIVCFSGDVIENLRLKFPKILENIDLLIDGEFDEDKKDFSRPWVGSINQRYHFLTDRYNNNIISEYKNKIEVNIDKDGFVFINGMGDFDKLCKQMNFPAFH